MKHCDIHTLVNSVNLIVETHLFSDYVKRCLVMNVASPPEDICMKMASLIAVTVCAISVNGFDESFKGSLLTAITHRLPTHDREPPDCHHAQIAST